MASKISILSRLRSLSMPSMAFLEMLIAINKIGMTKGKLNMAIKVALLPAFDAMPDTMVRQEDKPTAPRIKFKTNIVWSWTGLPRIRLKTPYRSEERRVGKECRAQWATSNESNKVES